MDSTVKPASRASRALAAAMALLLAIAFSPLGLLSASVPEADAAGGQQDMRVYYRYFAGGNDEDAVNFTTFLTSIGQSGDGLEARVNNYPGELSLPASSLKVYTDFASSDHKQTDITAECSYDEQAGTVTVPAKYAGADLSAVFHLAQGSGAQVPVHVSVDVDGKRTVDQDMPFASDAALMQLQAFDGSRDRTATSVSVSQGGRVLTDDEWTYCDDNGALAVNTSPAGGALAVSIKTAERDVPLSDEVVAASSVMPLSASNPQVGERFSVELSSDMRVFGVDRDVDGAHTSFGYPEDEGHYRFYVCIADSSCDLVVEAGRQGRGGSATGGTGDKHDYSFTKNHHWIQCECISEVNNGAAPYYASDAYVEVESISTATNTINWKVVATGVRGADGERGQSVEGRFTTEIPYGKLQINKTNANPSLTAGNDCYAQSFEGTTFGVYTDKACTELYKNVKIGAGNTATLTDVPVGTYWVKETGAVEGFQVNATAKSASVQSARTATVTVADEPTDDPGAIAIYKWDSQVGWDSKNNNPQAGLDLSGAEFTVKYYDQLNDDKSVSEDHLMRTWVFKTNEKGQTFITNDSRYFIAEKSDPMYTQDDVPTLPRGTYTVQETRNPDGYLLNDAVLTVQVEDQDDWSNQYLGQQAVNVEETPVRNDLQLVKTDDRTGRPLEGVPFMVSLLDESGQPVPGMSHVIVTDANGAASTASSAAAHSRDTNANDAAVSEADDGSWVVDESKLSPTAGVWFGQTAEGADIAVDDSLGALPAGRYLVSELPVSANDGLQLTSRVVQVRSDASASGPVDVDIVDYQPQIDTVLTDSDDGDHYICTDSAAPITDAVTIDSLEPDSSFTLTAKLYDRADLAAGDAQPLATSDYKFDSGKSTSVVAHMDFEVDSRAIDGHKLVMFEYLYDASGRLLASHEDADDLDQTVEVASPAIGTTATDGYDGDKVFVTDPKAVIVDEVDYSGVRAHVDHELRGTLWKWTADGGEQLTVAGEPVTASTTFDGKTDGTANVRFTFDATKLDQQLEPGDKVVAFEELYRDGVKVAEHSDIDDGAQAVTYDRPELMTTAADGADGDSTVSADGKTEVVDTVRYENLVPGLEYKVVGTLMDKSTGQPVEVSGKGVTAEATFVPKEASGSVEVTFELDTSAMADGTGLVAFEKLYRLDAEVASHEDIGDEGQTVLVGQPALHTTATDALDGDKTTANDPDDSIDDEVAYDNLVAGGSYTLYGILMDKATGLPYVPASAGVDQQALAQWFASYEEALNLSAPSAGSVPAPVDLAADKAQFSWGDGSEPSALSAGVNWTATVDDGMTLQVKTAPDGQFAPADGNAYTFALPTDGEAGYVAFRAVDADGAAVDGAQVHFAPADGAAALPAAADLEALSSLLGEGDAVGAAVSVQSADFSPEGASGSQLLAFDVDTTDATGDLVVFEALVRDGSTVGVHADIDDEGQTVTVVPRAIGTKAADAADGDQEIEPSAGQTIVDTVHYENCIPGDELTVTGILYDKSTGKPVEVGGEQVTGTTTFTAESASGDVQVYFDLDASGLAGTDLVAFEYLYKGDVQVASHEDIDDESQTVHVSEAPGGGSSSPLSKTGDLLLLCLFVALVCGAAGLIVVKATVGLRAGEGADGPKEE